jgi:EmrB/QacA subfamily drug resistance transporter
MTRGVIGCAYGFTRFRSPASFACNQNQEKARMDRTERSAIAHRRSPVLPEPAPLHALTGLAAYPWLVVAVACLGAFAGQVDASIVQLGLPTLERAFGAPLNEVSWVAVAYSLSFAAVLPIYARLAEMAGRKLMYILGFALFGVFSALCGLAPSLPWLIAFRVLQGISGALLGANSVVILIAVAGPARRARAMGFFAAAQAVGVSAGPALGGMLLGSLSWHWIFWVTVPFAVLGAILGWLLVPVSTRLSRDTSLDWVGAALLVPALTTLMLAISKLNAWGALSYGVLGCAAAAILLFIGFRRHEGRTGAPLIHPGLFLSRAFSGGTIAVLLSYAMLYGMFFAMSFALVRGYHDAPLTAGLRLALVPVALGLVAPFSGAAAELRPRQVMLGGMALCVAAVIWLRWSLTGAADSLPWVMAGLVAYGAGLGFFIAPNNSATLAAAPADHAGQAGGLLNLMRAFGTATGVAGASALLSWRLELATGLHESTIAAEEHALLGAAGDVLLLMAVYAVVAGAASALSDRTVHAA